MEVATGPRARIGAVNITVSPRDRKERQQISGDNVRSTLGFEPGDLYRERDLENAKRALYLSDAYRHVEVSPDTATLAPTGDSTIDVNVSLAETYMRSIRPSVGWATLDCFRTQVDYSDFGFLGEAGVNVLKLNLAMDALPSSPEGTRARDDGLPIPSP